MLMVNRGRRAIREEQRRGDQDLATSLAEDFGPGKVRLTARARALPLVILPGFLLAFVAATTGILVVFAFDAKVIDAAVFGGLFLLGCVLLGVGIARSTVISRLFWYDGGLVQLTGDEPERGVLGWSDLETVTTWFGRGEQTGTMFSGCILRGGTGTVLRFNCSGDDHLRLGTYRSRVLRRLVAEADSVLAARLVPSLIEIYESGEPVKVGNASVDRAGITVDSRAGGYLAWSEIRSMETKEVGMFTGTHPIYGISIIKHAQKARPVDISIVGVPNGMFLPHLLAYAAARNHLPLYTQPVDRFAQWRAFSRDEAGGG
jgi:hypothetical protein